MQKTTHFAVSRDKNGGYRWKLIGGNGESVATGESYKTRRAMMNAITNLRNWATTDRIEEPKANKVAKKAAKKSAEQA